MHNILLLHSHFVRFIFSFLPDAPIVMRFRGWFYSLGMKDCGQNLQVAGGAVLRGLENITCGRDVYIGPNSFIMAREDINIGDEVLIAMNVVIVDGNHGKDKVNNSYRFLPGKREAISIGTGSWIAANSVITAGSVVGAGKLVPPCSVIRGDFL
ncbi:maltose O-acetyltransferase [Oceanisphaera litoralis]|uniref:acyltransferase n=1 Tax=Oceanisphaera litoralis TaxID=225144 RepID=UPI001956DF92|nr:acyltransferase [Oceanisphaera litoralis]MBM7454924.1 maltose O-acetyltransferase [Oceanisphaera litoralis]